MNYMEQLAHMLGVELDEEFKVKKFNKTFKINKDGMYWHNENADDWIEWISANHILLDILFGDYEVENPILTEKEREYLSGVIKPFRDKVVDVIKNDYDRYEYIAIRVRNINEYMVTMPFPAFEKDTMYKGMKPRKGYSLNELGL